MAEIVSLTCGGTQLKVCPALGGGICAFTWRGRDVMRSGKADEDPRLLSSFVLLPFANRIAGGVLGETGLKVPVNRREIDPINAIHGYGWTSPWEVIEAQNQALRLAHSSNEGQWPWKYQAEQHFVLCETGLDHTLSLTNLAPTPMPAGLGFHPYFPRKNAKVTVDAEGLWHNDYSGLPSKFERLVHETGWLSRGPLDNVLTGIADPIAIEWPTHRLVIKTDPDLRFAHLYTPQGEDFFCLEPVSHMPDAINRSEADALTGLRWLKPEEVWRVTVSFRLNETI